MEIEIRREIPFSRELVTICGNGAKIETFSHVNITSSYWNEGDEIVIRGLNEINHIKSLSIEPLAAGKTIPAFKASLKDGRSIWVGVEKDGSLTVEFTREDGISCGIQTVPFSKKENAKTPA